MINPSQFRSRGKYASMQPVFADAASINWCLKLCSIAMLRNEPKTAGIIANVAFPAMENVLVRNWLNIRWRVTSTAAIPVSNLCCPCYFKKNKTVPRRTCVVFILHTILQRIRPLSLLGTLFVIITLIMTDATCA
jgi:hypothetical protein